MDPSEARTESLRLHGDLRAAMRQALILARRVKHGDYKSGPRLREVARELERAVRKQIDVEGHALAPVLKTIDAWGKIRCEQLADAHRREMAAVERAESAEVELQNSKDTNNKCWVEFAGSVDDLVKAILKCLRFEEAHLLDPATLRDDVIVVDTIDG